MRRYSVDKNGFPFELPEAQIDWREKEKIRSEINTNYDKYVGKPYAIHYSYGIDDKPYIYYFENRGFDDINIYKRRKG